MNRSKQHPWSCKVYIRQEVVLVTPGISTSWFWFPQSGQHLVLKTDLRATGLQVESIITAEKIQHPSLKHWVNWSYHQPTTWQKAFLVANSNSSKSDSSSVTTCEIIFTKVLNLKNIFYCNWRIFKLTVEFARVAIPD